MQVPPMVKYTLARVGMFVVVGVALAPLVGLLLGMVISAIVTSVLALFVLRRWRDEVASTIETSMTRKRNEKAKLRSALAGDDLKRR